MRHHDHAPPERPADCPACGDEAKKHHERDLIEAAFRDWWHTKARLGMGALEAGASLIEVLDAAGLKITRK